MGTIAKTQKDLLAEIQTLQLKLEEAEETLRAIRTGEVDALVVDGLDGERIFTLEGADRPYRLMVERMSEGAVTVDSDGTILYCNESFAAMVDKPVQRVIGSQITQYIFDDDLGDFATLIETGKSDRRKIEIRLRAETGALAPVLVSSSSTEEHGVTCLVISDLTEHRRNQELLASQKLSSALHEQSESARRHVSMILESITDSYIAFDNDWRVAEVNQVAAKTVFARAREELIGQIFWELYPQAVDTEFYQQYHKAKAEGHPVHFEAASKVASGRWFEAHAYPSANALSVYMRDISERRHAQQEREQLLVSEQQARSEAQKANRLKDEFLANISHELRTPLNAVLGWATIMRRAPLDEVGRTRALESIERNARSQAQLIEDLLDVSRITSGKLRLDFKPIEIVSVIKAAIDSVRPGADAKGVQLEIVLDPSADRIEGDASRLQQVVWNLLANAVKFTPSGGQVRVNLESAASKAKITVSDTGEGITPEFLPYVFGRFQQADGATTKSHGGLGLGLAIARHLVEMHGGTINAASEGVGRGAIFTVTIPTAAAPRAKEMEDESVRSQERASIQAELPNLSGLRVLTIDDEDDARNLVRAVLENCGAEVLTAGSAGEGLESLRGWKPHLLICDIGMPDEDGYSFIRRARESEQGANIPAIALTAYVRVEDRMRVLESGYQMFLPKPVEATELASTVARLCVTKC